MGAVLGSEEGEETREGDLLSEGGALEGGAGGGGVAGAEEETLRAEGLVDPLHVGIGVGEGVPAGLGDGAELGDLDPAVGPLGHLKEQAEVGLGVRGPQVDLREVVDDDGHVRMGGGHLRQPGQLPGGDKEVENGAKPLGRSPEDVGFLRAQPPVAAVLAVLVIDRAEPHPGQPVLLHPKLELVRDLRVGGVNEPMPLEAIRVPLAAIGHVRVIPAVADGLNQHAMGAVMLVHLRDQHLHRARVRHPLEILGVRMRERIPLRVVRPHMHVRINHPRRGVRRRGDRSLAPSQRQSPRPHADHANRGLLQEVATGG